MNPAVLVLAVLFAVAGYQEARRFARQYGQTPGGWDPWVWAVVMFLSWVIGIVLLAIAERQGRSRAARQPAYAGGYEQQMYGQQGYGQPAVAGAMTPTTPNRFGIMEPTTATPAAYAGAPAAAATAPAPAAGAPAPAPAAVRPAAMWSADPTGRHQYRWWDGAVWTPNVSTN